MTGLGSVVVTGGSSGIGRAICRRLTTAGYVVVSVDLQAPAEDPGSSMGAQTTVLGDVADQAILEEALRCARDRSPLAGWVNNAAVVDHEIKPMGAWTATEIDRMMSVNLLAPIRGCCLAVQAFLDQGTGGAIVNVSSIHATQSFRGCGPYDISKAGLEGLTRVMAADYGSAGIRVNAIAPALVTVESVAAYLAAAPAEEAARLQRFFESRNSRGRIVEPAEVALVVEFLLGPQSSALNGIVVPVDAGQTAFAVDA